MKYSNYLLIMILTISLSGCALRAIESKFIGVCKELLIEHKIWEGSEQAYMGATLLTTSEVNSIFWDKDVIGVLPIGSRVRVSSIYQDWNGSWGNFLRIKVEVLDGEFRGLLAEVPSIAPYHPRPRWITEWVSDPDELQFNSKLIAKCF